MDPANTWPDVPGDVRDRVEVIVASVVRDDELNHVVVGWSTRTCETRPLDPAVEDDETELWAWVVAAGETFRCPLWQPALADAGSWPERFADQLEDFIAESRFGWGQQRVVPVHLRRGT